MGKYSKPQWYANYRSKNHLQHLLWDAKYRAKKSGIEFSITIEDIVVPNVCPINLKPFGKDNPMSLDRVDNEIGYTKENTRVISLEMNRLKKDAELEDVVAIAVYMATHKIKTAGELNVPQHK
jgi:hypothetical protein